MIMMMKIILIYHGHAVTNAILSNQPEPLSICASFSAKVEFNHIEHTVQKYSATVQSNIANVQYDGAKEQCDVAKVQYAGAKVRCRTQLWVL